MNDCETLVPNLGTVSVKWLRHTDGIYYGKQFFEANQPCRGALIAQAKQVAVKGRVGKVPENGRQLEGKYSALIELKPGDFRFLGFRDGNVFLITNGARKDPKLQHRDYDFALQIREEYLAKKSQSAAKQKASQHHNDKQKKKK